MFGFIILIATAVYLLLIAFVTRAIYRWARTKGWSKPWASIAGAIGFVAVYVPLFSDQIPTFVRHYHYCSKEAGFWTYKTLGEWKQENPTVLDALSRKNAPQATKTNGVLRTWTTQRFFVDRVQDQSFRHAITREEVVLYDAVTKQPLARAINFYRGRSGNVLGVGGSLDDIRQYFVLGLGNRHCDDVSPTERFNMFEDEFARLGDGK